MNLRFPNHTSYIFFVELHEYRLKFGVHRASSIYAAVLQWFRGGVIGQY